MGDVVAMETDGPVWAALTAIAVPSTAGVAQAKHTVELAVNRPLGAVRLPVRPYLAVLRRRANRYLRTPDVVNLERGPLASEARIETVVLSGVGFLISTSSICNTNKSIRLVWKRL
jgi:hypothetical protein